MKSKSNQISYKIRKNSGLWLREHDTLHKIASSFNKTYYTLSSPFRMLPDFLIIGAARCGTTSLYEYLISHPNISSASGKEVYFFDKKYSKGLNWYKSFFPFKSNTLFHTNLSKNKILTGEATPRYLYHHHSPKRIFKTLPNVKLIVLLRNPIDRAYSHYQMEVDHNHETLSFEDAIEKEKSIVQHEIELMDHDENYYSVEFYRKSYLTRGIYVTQLKNWFKFFPRNQFLILKSEDFYFNTSDVYNKVLKFLELPEYNLQQYKQFKMRPYSSMNDEIRKKLTDYFTPYNKELYKLLGTNFNWEEK